MNDINLGISLGERGAGRGLGTGGKSSAKQHAGAVYENALPNSQRGRAKADLQAILITATREETLATCTHYINVYAPDRPNSRGFAFAALTRLRRSCKAFLSEIAFR
jgi:hypothetical protein